MPRMVFHIEASLWNNPAIPGIVEKLLMEIAYTVCVGLVYLTEAFFRYDLLH